jgi:hypothetical protein
LPIDSDFPETYHLSRVAEYDDVHIRHKDNFRQWIEVVLSISVPNGNNRNAARNIDSAIADTSILEFFF